MLFRQPKSGRPTAEELRTAYRKRLFEVLDSAKDDWSVSVEDMPQVLPFDPDRLTVLREE